MDAPTRITLSESASERIKRYLAADSTAVGFRFGVEKTGCSGWAYVVELCQKIGGDDHVFEDDGVTIVVNSNSLPIVSGTRIDFVRTGINHVFSFDNPNAAAACGCGESFTLSDPDSED